MKKPMNEYRRRSGDMEHEEEYTDFSEKDDGHGNKICWGDQSVQRLVDRGTRAFPKCR